MNLSLFLSEDVVVIGSFQVGGRLVAAILFVVVAKVELAEICRV
jgi:hypothetical protein